MPNGSTITLCLLLAAALAGPTLAQESDQDPWADADQAERAVIAAQLMTYLGPRIDHIAEDLAKHCQLGEVPRLRVSAQAVLQRDDLNALFRDASDVPSLEPFLRAILAKHLNAQQLEDYQAFTQARQDRDRQAVAGQMVAWVDQHLSLTSEQRSKVGQVFLLSAGECMTAQGLLSGDVDVCIHLIAKLDLDAERLEEVLSSSQTQVWELTISKGDKRAWWRRNVGPEKREKRFAELQADIIKSLETGRITHEQAARKLEAAKKELRTDSGVRRDNDIKREAQIRRVIAAKLAAHTEQLGELDTRRSKRLALVTKGVVEEVIESWDISQQDDPTANIMDHPLYQQTIKHVLPEDAYNRYLASQTQRTAFRDQALRDLVMAYLDTHLLLSETQRHDFAEISAKLTIPPKANAWVLLVQVLRQVEPKELSQWQCKLVDGILKPRARWER